MKNILSLSILFLLTKGIFAQNSFAQNQLDGLKILFHYGQNEVSILEFTESAAYEIDDEAGLNREFEGDYEAQTDGNIVSVTIFEQNGAREVYRLNFTTAGTGTGTLDDFQYLQPDQVDDTFEPTDQPNLYKDLIGSGDFTFELLGSVHREAIPHIILKGITMIITMGTTPHIILKGITMIITMGTTPHIILKGTTLIKKSITQIMVIMIWSLNLSLLPISKVSWQIS